ncbi:serine hydrolase [Mesorhizobium muleiense]|uniref:serine hydrolase n=1 Tax=Mesorhizobium muleiense TaxID=1004279 RepID=UPI003AFB4FB9
MIKTALILAIAIATTQPAAAKWINNQLNQQWVSLRDLTSAEFSSKFAEYRAADYLIIDVDAYPTGSGLRYSMVWERNTDERAWAEYRDMTSAEYATRLAEFRARGYRLHDFDSYQSGTSQRYAAIWVLNTEGVSWWSRRDMTGAQYAAYFIEERRAGRRPVDIEAYMTSSGLRYAAIWYENVDDVAWVQLRDMSRDTYQAELNEQSANGYRMIDFESYRSGWRQLYAAIWEKNASGRSWQIRSDRTELEYANLWRQYRDDGYRLVDFEHYNTIFGPRYAGLWVENDTRFDYSRKGQLDTLIDQYRVDNDLAGISVAVIRNGQVIYRRGFGFADVNDGRVAHGETIYSAASLSKVIAGTLAAKLEDEGELRNGTDVDLVLHDLASDYLSDIPLGGGEVATIPGHHTQRVEELLAHLACVGHYDTTPSIENQTTHYATAVDAVRSIWNVGLVVACTVGATVSYSTPAFTFVAAVLERATGRPADRLIRSEMATPYGLSSLRVQWETSSLPADYDRAAPYTDSNDETTYTDSSWKMYGGGLELHVVDLARFGWRVLDGQIVAPAARDARLWAAVRRDAEPLPPEHADTAWRGGATPSVVAASRR